IATCRQPDSPLTDKIRRLPTTYIKINHRNFDNVESFHSFRAEMEAKAMDVKERILSKAADLFMRYGIRSITMDEIASQLGISKKTIYQFFTDKDDLVSAVIEREISANEMECVE